MRTIVFDIETVPDESVPFESVPKMKLYADVVPLDGDRGGKAEINGGLLFDARPFAPPPCHKIVCIGYAAFNEHYELEKMKCVDGENEAELVTRFAPYAFGRTVRLVTWNGRGFDVPVVIMRSFKYGADLSEYYKSRNRAYRYASPDCEDGHVDLMDRLSDFGAGRQSQLAQAAKMIGLPGKPEGVDGGGVADMIAQGKLVDVQRYCLTDVFQLAVMWLRWEWLRGVMPESDYHVSVTKVFAAVEEIVKAGGMDAAYVAKADRDALGVLRQPSSVGQ